MKKKLILGLIGFLLFSFTSCAPSERDKVNLYTNKIIKIIDDLEKNSIIEPGKQIDLIDVRKIHDEARQNINNLSAPESCKKLETMVKNYVNLNESTLKALANRDREETYSLFSRGKNYSEHIIAEIKRLKETYK